MNDAEDARFTLAEILETVRRIDAQTKINSETIARILMLTVEMQRAANRTMELATAVRRRVAELTGGDVRKRQAGATSDEVLGMLSPIASALQDALDLLSSAGSKGETPAE